MKKTILSIILILFIICSCSCTKNNQYTTSGMINNVQTQMNGVMKSIRGMDNIYLEDYAINQINPISFNNPINYTGYYPNYNIATSPYYYPNNNYMYNTGIPYAYNYATYPYNYRYNMYNGYNNYTGTNYNIDTYKNFNSNVDTYMANNGIYGNSIIPGQSNNIIVSNTNEETKSVSNVNASQIPQYQPYSTYQPKYISQNGQQPNRSYLQSYMSSIEDLFLITSDLNAANQKLTSISNSIIELTVNIKNNVYYLNYNQTNLSPEQISIINEYVSTIDNILTNLKTSYGYIKNEVSAISKMKENFYVNAEALNAKYINVLNIIETRIIQLESLQVTLLRMNNQILSYINIFNPNILPFNQNFNNQNLNQFNDFLENNNNNNNSQNQDLNENLNDKLINENANINKELMDNNENKESSTNEDIIIQNGEENEINIETNIVEEDENHSIPDSEEKEQESDNSSISDKILKLDETIEDEEIVINQDKENSIENIKENNNDIEQVNEEAKELHDQVEEMLDEILNSSIQ